MRRAVIWGVSALALIAIIWGMSKLSGDVPSTGPGNLSVPVNDSDNIYGPASASMTVVEYSDFQCPACAAFYAVTKQLLAEPDAQHVRFIYRHFPLQYHTNAQIAAQASQAAAMQGKFWEMHDKLFENQNIWSAQSSAAARQAFIGYARALGLDESRFSEDMDSDEAKDKILADKKSGNDSNVDATPTFFINGVKMPQPQSYEEFKDFVLNGVPTPTP